MICRDWMHHSGAVQAINRFFRSVPYIFFICLLTLLSNVLSCELPVYTLYILIGVYVCLFGEDLLGLLPVVACAYISPSAVNNPGRNGASVFSGGSGVYILCLAAVLAAALLVRLIRERKQFFCRSYQLMGGMALLGVAYLLGGMGSPAYPALAGKHILFSLLQLAALILPYLLFSGGIRWDKTPCNHLAWIGFGMGLTLVAQILWSYVTGDVVVDGVIDRDRIFTGWGMYNNMGGMLAMMIPFAFCLASRYRRGWMGTVVGAIFLLAVIMTCSRSSVLVGSAVFLLCSVMMHWTARNKKGNLTALLICVGITAVLVLVFHRPLMRLFGSLLGMITDPSHRDEFYQEGFRQFLKYPVFGGSFYPIGFTPWDWATESAFSSFFPPRWHNTVIQLLACCGAVGMGAYLFHRYQTVRLLWRRRSWETAYLGCALLVLWLTSLLDCHLFNIGPAIFSSLLLAFAENVPLPKTGEEKANKGLATFGG